MQNEYFKDKVALITGSSRGIGKAMARKFATSGSDVVICHRQAGGSAQKQAEELYHEIEAMGRRAHLIQTDISKKQSVKDLIGETQEKFGKLDFLILNAAKAPFKPIERLLERELRQLVDTNYLGNIFCIQQSIPLLEQSGGKIVFISSLGSRYYNPAYPLGSMKAAMETVVRDCSVSLREKNISVNGVCGGLVKTDSFKVLRQYIEELEFVPDELFVETGEIADAVMFLCSPDANGISGQMIVVDRGLSNRLHRPVKTK